MRHEAHCGNVYFRDTSARNQEVPGNPIIRYGSIMQKGSFGYWTKYRALICGVIFKQLIVDLISPKMRKWRAWKDETMMIEYQYNNARERFRFARETTFGHWH
ncbi:MLO-like protein 6 [Artemisia annua]|uniref:MLO-like protein 6 n=1 Tax=Artemisia annua TaxID=35608 RepID=A0A2U1LTQ8_ARTAN|nr:MLO-like protein 6 [Artemisia annua]